MLKDNQNFHLSKILLYVVALYRSYKVKSFCDQMFVENYRVLLT